MSKNTMELGLIVAVLMQFLHCCRSAVSFLRASETTTCLSNPETDSNTSELKLVDDVKADDEQRQDFRFPFGDWFSHPWLKQEGKPKQRSDARCHHSDCSYKCLYHFILTC